MSKKIAITGGIGSGKSMVLQILREKGYPTFSCDEIYKEVIATPAYIKKIKNRFPSCVENDIINRQKLSQIVFNDKKALQDLNAISHPMIMEKLQYEMSLIEDEICFAEVPLLLEGNYEKDFHETIFVKRNLKDRIQAVMLRDSIDEQNVLDKIKTQFDPDSAEGQKRLNKLNIHILDNNCPKETLINRLENLIKLL